MEYSLYTHILFLWRKGFQLLRKCTINATDNKSFGSVLTAINEVRKHIYYKVANIFVFFYQWLYDGVFI